MVGAPGRREPVRPLINRELSERRLLAIASLSASICQYGTQPNHNIELRARICALANRHKRYRVGMIYIQKGVTAKFPTFRLIHFAESDPDVLLARRAVIRGSR